MCITSTRDARYLNGQHIYVLRLALLYGYIRLYGSCGVAPAPGGGGVLGLEKGTDCGPTAGERWLSRPAMSKKKRGGGGAVLISYCRKGGLSESVQKIFPIK